MVGYIHSWLTIHCSSSPLPLSCRSDPLLSFATQLWVTHRAAQLIWLVEYIEPGQGRWGMSIIHFQFTVLPAFALPGHPLATPTGLTGVKHLKIYSNWLGCMVNQFVSSSTSCPCKHPRVRSRLTLNSLHNWSFPFCVADPVWVCADQVRFPGR